MSGDESDLFNVEDGISYYKAASAGVAQAVALAAQNKVDEIRNQVIVQRTAMGAAYAKWLENPQMGKELFKPIIDDTILDISSIKITAGLESFRKLTEGKVDSED